MNRRDSERFPDSICEVVTYPHAFTWYTHYKKLFRSDELSWFEFVLNLYGSDKVEYDKAWLCYSEAMEAYLSDSPATTSTHYLTVERMESREVSWPMHGEVLAVIGNHVFLHNVP